jgi:serine/threonine-protein kinase
MAEVFEAELLGAEGFARPVAIKRMLPALSADAAFGDMFVNEAQIASLLHHENIVSVLDFDRDENGRFFIVMELLHGLDLRALMRSGHLPYGISALIGAKVLNGLSYAHELERNGRPLGIVHRDVSPHNVMISWDGGVKVVDFGIAKAVAATGVSHSGSLKGKVGYMSPEQAHGVELDGRSDVFAVGVMLHEMLTGARLFDGSTQPEILARLLTQPIPSPREVRGDVPADLARVAERMLARDRDERYPNAHVAMDELLACQCVSARAQLELRALLRERFPEQAPRRSGSEGVQRFTPTPQQRPAVASPMALDNTYSAGITPTPAGERVAGPPQRRSRLGTWIALAATLWITSMIATLVVMGSSEEAGHDAGDEIAAAETPPDAAPIAALVPTVFDASVPVDATQVATNDEPETKRDRDKKKRDKKKRDKKKKEREADKKKTDPKDDAKEPVAKKPASKETGTVKVVVRPWAKISIGSKSYGKSPKTITLPEGRHTIRLVNPDLGKDEKVPVTITADERTNVSRNWMQ